MPEIKERPILFSGPMVRAILEGRKTVTRRAVKPQPEVREVDRIGPMLTFKNKRGGRWLYPNAKAQIIADCPYGQPGARLWVRETWGVISHTWNEQGDMVDWAPDRPATAIRELPFGRGYYSGHLIYAADGPNEWAGDDDGGGEPRSAWHPSIHMPRAASRILLEITDVRVERLQAITWEQALDEGIGDHRFECDRPVEPDGYPACNCGSVGYVDAFADLWNSTGGDWEANPWVWVVEFRRVQP